MSFRYFDLKFEALARRWRDQVYTRQHWTEETRPRSEGDSGTVWVRSGNDSGIGKPIKRRINFDHAASEKIASDLAHDLLLPIPPVVLWQRNPVDPDQERDCCISASVPDARELEPLFKSLSGEEQTRLRQSASAMLPFNYWIAAQDRQILNTLIGSGAHGEPVFVFIDYARSFAGNPNFSSHGSYHHELLELLGRLGGVCIESARYTVQQILDLPDVTIAEIVHRIPSRYFTLQPGGWISDHLISRKSTLTGVLGQLS